MKGKASLPFMSQVELDKIDIVLVTHFHLDHAGALPWLLEKTTFKGRVFMTPATKAIYRWILEDYVRVRCVCMCTCLWACVYACMRCKCVCVPVCVCAFVRLYVYVGSSLQPIRS